MPGPGEQGTLHCRMPQDLLFMKSLCSRTENTEDFIKTEKQTHRGKQSETEEFIPNEGLEEFRQS